MATKGFYINDQLTGTGVHKNIRFNVSGIDKIRFKMINATPTTEVEVKVKIGGQSSFTTLGTLLTNGDRVFDIRTYDILELNVTAFGGGTPSLIGSGFKTGGVIITEYPDVPSFPPPSGSGDMAWSTADSGLYFDSPVSGVWESSSVATIPLTNSYVAYGSATDQITGDSDFTYDDVTDTLAVVKMNINSKDVESKLYQPEDIKVLNAGEITAKSITLTGTPLLPTKTRLVVQGGPDQVYGDDFTVSGNTLTWNGLGLDGVLEVGDKLIITFV